MRIERRSVAVRDLVKGFVDNGENGVFSMDGRLEIRPSFQREFRYSDKQQELVIDSILNECPIGVMYWVKNKRGESDFQLSVLDGQQRTLSICHFINGKFTYQNRGFANMGEELKNKILNYTIDVYMIIDATLEERLMWFERINIPGVQVNDQELRNAIYAGPFVTDARAKLSKTGCPAATQGAGYITGTPINQELLEKVLDWKATADGKKTIEDYLAAHQWDENANDLWTYYQRVINWTKSLFDPSKGITEKQNWGELYETYHENQYQKNVLKAEMDNLIADEDVTNHKGIIPYLLSGKAAENIKLLNIRAFTDKDKRRKLAEQEGKCACCGKAITLAEAEGDHIVAWVNSGHTDYDNLQVLCRTCNRTKSSK